MWRPSSTLGVWTRDAASSHGILARGRLSSTNHPTEYLLPPDSFCRLLLEHRRGHGRVLLVLQRPQHPTHSQVHKYYLTAPTSSPCYLPIFSKDPSQVSGSLFCLAGNEEHNLQASSPRKMAAVHSWGWSDGPAIKSTYCSCRGPGSGPCAHAGRLPTAGNSSSRGSNPASALCGCCTHTHTYAHNDPSLVHRQTDRHTYTLHLHQPHSSQGGGKAAGSDGCRASSRSSRESKARSPFPNLPRTTTLTRTDTYLKERFLGS